MNTTNLGRSAEVVVAESLSQDGYKILELNWRNRFCEIDIIAVKDKVANFIEVKYRATGKHGDGLDFITPKKTNQMRFAAEMWVNDQKWEGDYRLLAIAVSGLPGDYTLGQLTEVD